MSAVHNPEADVIARIEQLELEARDLRRRVEHARGRIDKQVLDKQLAEIKQHIEVLRTHLPYSGHDEAAGDHPAARPRA